MSYRVVRRGDAWRPELAAALEDPEGVLSRPDTRILKRGRSGRIVGIADVKGDACVFKVFVESSFSDVLQRWALGSAASRVSRGIARMRAAGFRAPELVAVLEKRGRSCVVTRAVAEGRRADEILTGLSPRERIAFGRELAKFVRELHGRGLYPQDLSAANLIGVRGEAGWQIVLVDLDRVRAYRRLSWERRLKNLVQIERSLRAHTRPLERAGFLGVYLGDVPRERAARMAREVLEASRRRDLDSPRPRSCVESGR
jgi:tRNA A-37 threonylcarbamoyl transferase component Bud32